jgi:hypothetical protein
MTLFVVGDGLPVECRFAFFYSGIKRPVLLCRPFRKDLPGAANCDTSFYPVADIFYFCEKFSVIVG